MNPICNCLAWILTCRLCRAVLFTFAFAFILPAAAHAGEAPSCTALESPDRAVREIARADGTFLERSEVTLPDRIPREWRGPGFSTRYLLAIGTCDAGRAARALLLFRVGGPYTVEGPSGPLAALREHGSTPYNGRVGGMFLLPAATGEVRVRLVGPPNVSGGLMRIAVGPQADVLAGPAEVHQRWLQGTLMTCTVLGVAGILGLMAAAVRGFDPRISLFSFACIVWAGRGTWLQAFGMPWPVAAYESTNPLLIAWSSLLVTASTLSLVGVMTRRRAGLWLALGLAALGGYGVAVAAPALSGAYRSLCFGGAFALLLAMVVLLLRRGRTLGVAYAGWLALGYAAVMVGGSHDLAMILGWLPAGWWTLLTPGFAVLLACHMVVVGLYVLRSLRQAEHATRALEGAIASRERLLRDMHDGLGSQLMSALRGLERGALAPPELARSLQDSLDELRMLMDSTDMESWLPGALAAWRNRWDARLAAAGIELEWAVDESLDRTQPGGEATLEALRVLQEACANIIKHARATRMKFHARLDEGPGGSWVVLEVEDDGVGLSPAAPRVGARGLANMRHRAQRVGGKLKVEAGPDGRGTRVELRLPSEVQATSPRLAASTAASAREEIPSLR